MIELGIVISESSGVRIQVERKPTLSTVPSISLTTMKSPILNGCSPIKSKRAEEVLERILGGERRGQADEPEPGQQPRDPLAVADQVDLPGNCHDQKRPA